MKRKTRVIGVVALAACAMTAVSNRALAVSITHGGTTVNMDFVSIGNVGNVAATSGYGAVNYGYQIGTKEVSVEQFLAAYNVDNRIGSVNVDLWLDDIGNEAPAVGINAYNAMKYSNWLTSGDAYVGAYQFSSSGVLTNVNRAGAVSNYGTVYVVPTEDEWYKAAYYRPDDDGSYSMYTNGSDDPADLIQGAPNGWNYYDGDFATNPGNMPWASGSGALEQNGTYDMLGNVWEWMESAYDGTLDSMSENRVTRGGGYGINGVPSLDSSNRYSRSPSHFGNAKGLRIAMIPEPSSVVLIGLVSGCTAFVRRLFVL